jgi:hypothetical protein
MLTFSQHNEHVEISYDWPEVGLSQRAQKVRFAAQNSDKQSGESYYKPSAVSHKLTVVFFCMVCSCLESERLFTTSKKFTN